MLRVLAGIFVILHGLVHLWYFTLSRRLVAFKPDMGWTGESWLFSGLLGDPVTRMLAALLYLLSTVAFVAGGLGTFLRAGWSPPVLTVAAILSVATIILFWDGDTRLIVQKGLLGLLISLAILVLLLTDNWPALSS